MVKHPVHQCALAVLRFLRERLAKRAPADPWDALRHRALDLTVQRIADSIHYRPLLSALNVKVIREASLSQLNMDLTGFTDEEVEFALSKFKKDKGIS